MNPQMTTQELRDQLTAHLDTVTPPPADLDVVLRRSRARNVRRVAGPALLAAAAVSIGVLVLTQTIDPSGPSVTGDPGRDVAVADGPVDLKEGLRAFASPDGKIYLAGVELDEDVEELDTGAVTTPYGIVHYDDTGWPTLLRPDGRSVQLDVTGSSEPAGDFHPTVKADALKPYVAFALMDGDDIEVTVYDLEKDKVVASSGITCSGGCPDLVIDGIDSGAVFLRLSSGTSVWDYERDETSMFARGDTRVADVRNGVVLYDGPPPTENTEGWRLVPGPIDGELTFDGEHVLSWSDELEPTTDGGTPLLLDLPEPATFFTMDTDGSVLAATAGNPSTVFDCELPSGACEEVGEMSTDSGDPMFVGDDM